MGNIKTIEVNRLDDDWHIEIMISKDLKRTNTKIDKELFEILSIYEDEAFRLSNEHIQIDIKVNRQLTDII